MDSAKEIWQTLTTNRLRTVLTGFSVAWGVFMLILLLAISKGVSDMSNSFNDKNDPNRISVWPGRTAKPYNGYKEGRRIKLKSSYFDDIKAGAPDRIDKVEGTVSISATVSTMRNSLASPSLQGVYPGYFSGQYRMVAGRPVNDADIRGRRKVLVMDEKSASVLFGDIAGAVGSVVRVGDLAFTLVGVFSHEWDRGQFMPFSTAMAINGFSDQLDEIDVHISNVRNERESGEVEASVRSSLASAAEFAADDKSAVHTYDRFAGYVSGQTANDILNTTMWVIGILTLVTGIVGVSNIMFVSVKERTHEIGIRRAIGAPPASILRQVVTEGVAMTTCFGYVGIVLGTAVTELVKRAFAGSDFPLRPSVDMAIAVEVTCALVIAGAIAGVFPALRALKIKPVEALREE